MPIREHTRLALPTLALSGLLLIVASFAAWYLHHAQIDSAHTLAQNVTRVHATEELMLLGTQIQLSLDQFLISGNRDAITTAESIRPRILQWIERFDELAESAQDHKFDDQIRSGYSQFHRQFDALIASPPDEERLPKSVSRSRDRLQTLILDPARQHQRYNRDRLVQSTLRAQTLANRMGVVLMLLGISGAVAGLMAGFAASRRVQQRIIDNQRAMAHSEQLATLGRVAAALAHEVRNPLTSMRIIVQSAAIDGDHVSMETKELSILEDEIERLDALIKTFLDYARPPQPEKRRCSLQKFVAETIALVQRRAALMDVEIQNQLPEETIEVNADAGQIKQILLNLMLNALEASTAGGCVTVAAEVVTFGMGEPSDLVHASLHDHVAITIRDRGSGLPENLDNRIFDAFFSTKETGTGLGLTICKRIIEDHGGQITAADAEPVGAEFTIRLPLT